MSEAELRPDFPGRLVLKDYQVERILEFMRLANDESANRPWGRITGFDDPLPGAKVRVEK